MPPARNAALSCAEPSVADTCSFWSRLKLSGSAPYCSCCASSLADDAVKLPLICVAWKAGIACSLTGADTTAPFSVKATKSAHGVPEPHEVTEVPLLDEPAMLCL